MKEAKKATNDHQCENIPVGQILCAGKINTNAHQNSADVHVGFIVNGHDIKEIWVMFKLHKIH
ncbi:MAG: hypothetical protein JST19_16485 [Bacteroidetes bacterium]|nr:hypothetical protein [Bacteroidota bacterium]